MRNTFLASLLTLAAYPAHAQTPTDTAPRAADAPVKELSPAELLAMIDSAKVHVYDCNEEETYREAHVPGSTMIAYDTVTDDLLPADHAEAIVFYCYSPECPAASMAARTASKLGHTRVYCMTAGILGWQDAGYRTEP